MQKNVEESLNRFSQSVINQALNVRSKMEEEMREEKKKVLDQRELEYLEEAYGKIQHQIAKLHRETSEHISKKVVEYKKDLILRREEIINEVIGTVTSKIKDFIKSPEYYNWLLESCKNVLDMISVKSGSAVLYINSSDSDYVERLSGDLKKIYNEASVEVKVYDSEDFIGGAKAFNPELGIEADNSIKSRIIEAKREILKTSGLIVD